MNGPLSDDTQAILLLTAPLIAGRSATSTELLTPGEYKRLAAVLRDLQSTPADLLTSRASALTDACAAVVAPDRMGRLLSRGFLLSQVVERWRNRAIWILGHTDEGYPQRFRGRLGEDAPPVLYGCGDADILDSGGLAVVGSRNAEEKLIDFTMAVGSLSARAGRTLISGGARGIDQAAMRGALEAGGRVSGVLADSLERSTMQREHRNVLLDGRMVLISPYDPNAGFNVGNAMQRNKLIYALADAALVVSSDLKKGGTWAGAAEQLDKRRFVPVFVRSAGEASEGLTALRARGGIPWPDPRDVDDFAAIFDIPLPRPQEGTQDTLFGFP